MTRKECNCEFCIKCDRCGHQADEHLAGDGACFICDCKGHYSWIITEWNRLSMEQIDSFGTFLNFADTMIEAKRLLALEAKRANTITDSDVAFEHQASLDEGVDDGETIH